VSSLEKHGWVERIADPHDRRVVLVRSTPKATRELVRLREERDAYLARRLGALTPDELDSIIAALPALERLLHEEDEP
jgi:DNA-binding MarR family transcriptional regulator